MKFNHIGRTDSCAVCYKEYGCPGRGTIAPSSWGLGARLGRRVWTPAPRLATYLFTARSPLKMTTTDRPGLALKSDCARRLWCASKPHMAGRRLATCCCPEYSVESLERPSRSQFLGCSGPHANGFHGGLAFSEWPMSVPWRERSLGSRQRA